MSGHNPSAQTTQAALPSQDGAPPLDFTFVIPAYNEENAIGDFLRTLRTSFPHQPIIVVDDASKDSTAEVVSKIDVTLLRHKRNRGYGGALKTGFKAAKTTYVLFLDSDGQHRVEDIAQFLPLIGQHDLIIGARGQGSHFPLLRRPGKAILQRVANFLVEDHIPDLNSGMRLVQRDFVLRNMHLFPDGFSFSTTSTIAAFKGGYDVHYVPIIVNKRIGTSTVNPIRDGWTTLMLIIRLVVLFDPLRVFVPLSFLIGGFGILFTILGLIEFGRVPNTGIVTILGAIQIFFFGIIADQIATMRRELGRGHDEVS